MDSWNDSMANGVSVLQFTSLHVKKAQRSNGAKARERSCTGFGT